MSLSSGWQRQQQYDRSTRFTRVRCVRQGPWFSGNSQKFIAKRLKRRRRHFWISSKFIWNSRSVQSGCPGCDGERGPCGEAREPGSGEGKSEDCARESVL